MDRHSYQKLVIILIQFVYANGDREDFCQGLTSGVYCKPDLSGYRRCGGFWWNAKVIQDVSCPEGLKCACFLNNECQMVEEGDYGERINEIKEDQICQKIKSASPIKRILNLKYSKQGFKLGNPHEDEIHRFSEKGSIFQDLNKKKYKRTWVDLVSGLPNLRFEIVVPHNSNLFIKFTGAYPGKCKAEIVQEFKEFGHDIQYYRILESKKSEQPGFYTQVWYNKLFRVSDSNGLTHKWTVKLDRDKSHVIPVKYENTYTGTQEEQCCDHYITIKYQEDLVDEKNNTDEWFYIPNFCSNI